MKLSSFGPLYCGTIEYYHERFFPIVERGWTQEAEAPYRKGTCLVFRFPCKKPGFYLGLWKFRSALPYEDEDLINDRLAEALNYRGEIVPVEEIGEDFV